MIRIQQLNKRFRKLQALRDIHAEFQKGQVIALIGPNGSGKTTLIKSLLGLVTPDSGSIEVNGRAIDQHPGYRSQIGYMPQIGRYPDNMKIGQLFQMMENVRPCQTGEPDRELLEAFRLHDMFDKPMRTLSGGTRQKVSAALAFYFDPAILVLDEPTAGLDPLSAEILKKKIIREKRKNKLILITSHVLSDLDELITHIFYLQEGRQQFFRSLSELRSDTGEDKISRIIARFMEENSREDAPDSGIAVGKDGSFIFKSHTK